MFVINNSAPLGDAKMQQVPVDSGRIIAATVTITVGAIALAFFAVYKFLQSFFIYQIMNQLEYFLETYHFMKDKDFKEGCLDSVFPSFSPEIVREIEKLLIPLLNMRRKEIYSTLQEVEKQEFLQRIRSLLKEHSTTIFFGRIACFFAGRSFFVLKQKVKEKCDISSIPSDKSILERKIIALWHYIFPNLSE